MRGAIFESVRAANSKRSSPAVGTHDYALGLLRGNLERRALVYTTTAGRGGRSVPTVVDGDAVHEHVSSFYGRVEHFGRSTLRVGDAGRIATGEVGC